MRSLADMEVRRSFYEPITGTLLFCLGGRRMAFSSLWLIFFSERTEAGGGGISAANYLRMCLVTSSSRMSLGSLTMFRAAVTSDLLLRYFERDF